MTSFLKCISRSNSNLLVNQLNQQLKKSLSSYSLIFKSFGNPNDVLELVDTTSEVLQPSLQAEDVIVQFKASPINPGEFSKSLDLFISYLNFKNLNF